MPTPNHWYSSIISSSSKILYTYDRAATGFSAVISATQAAHPRAVPGVLAVLPDRVRHLHTTHTPQSTPDFPSSACNKKIIGARAYYSGYTAKLGSKIDETIESLSPRDREGHGTHTASTAAGSVVANASFFQYAKGEARGMAIKARISVYKICWTLGCYDSDILAAMDQAVADGVHVISLSVGASGYAPLYDLSPSVPAVTLLNTIAIPSP